MSEFKKFRKSQIAEMRTWEIGDDVGAVSISTEDRLNGSPKAGDMIARNPKNHSDEWLVSGEFFAGNYVAVTE